MTSIVDKTAAAAASNGDDNGGSDALEATRRRLITEQARFLVAASDDGPVIFSVVGLAQVVHEITAECATDTVREVAGELATADDQVRYLVDLLVASDERGDRLAAENESLRAELSGREPVN